MTTAPPALQKPVPQKPAPQESAPQKTAAQKLNPHPASSPPPTPQPDAILLLAHGTPDVLGDMPAYLANVTSGRPLPTSVVEELQHRYAQIGLGDTPLPEGPPLTRWTLAQARLLAAALHLPVYAGMRNWHPFLGDVIQQMQADGIRHFRAICLAPQNSRTSVGLYRRAALEAITRANQNPAHPHSTVQPGGDLHMDFLAGWSDHPLLAQAFALRLWAAWAEVCAASRTRIPVLFTAHAVPCRTLLSSPSPDSASPPASPSAAPGAPVPAEGIQNYGAQTTPDPYPVECKRTAQAVARALAPVGMSDRDWFFAFQSQGVAGAPWIGPTVEDTLQALAAQGYPGVLLQPIGFLCDHVEILYDIDIAFEQTARDLGMKLWRAESLNDSPVLIAALAELALGQWKPDPPPPAELPVA